MLERMTDFIRAGVGWYEVFRRDRMIAREKAHEDRLAPFFAAAATDSAEFRRLLETIRRNEVRELHRRLSARATLFGDCFSQRDIEARGNIQWARDELLRLFPRDTVEIKGRKPHDFET